MRIIYFTNLIRLTRRYFRVSILDFSSSSLVHGDKAIQSDNNTIFHLE